jgi:hypothetical protein
MSKPHQYVKIDKEFAGKSTAPPQKCLSATSHHHENQPKFVWASSDLDQENS